MAVAPDRYSTMVDSSTNGESQSPFREIVASRVRARANDRSITQSKLADVLSASTSTIGTYWHGTRPWPAEMLAPLAKVLGWSIDELITGEAAKSASKLLPNTQESEPDLVEVQEVNLAYGLGGAYADDEIQVERHRFPRAWLEMITRAPASQLVIARGRGDSMQPTIQDGDMVLIDRSDRTVREQDLIWALAVGDIAMIKRVRVRGEQVAILSDNQRIPPDEYHHEEIHIVGRIVFIGRRI